MPELAPSATDPVFNAASRFFEAYPHEWAEGEGIPQDTLPEPSQKDLFTFYSAIGRLLPGDQESLEVCTPDPAAPYQSSVRVWSAAGASIVTRGILVKCASSDPAVAPDWEADWRKISVTLDPSGTGLKTSLASIYSRRLNPHPLRMTERRGTWGCRRTKAELAAVRGLLRLFKQYPDFVIPQGPGEGGEA